MSTNYSQRARPIRICHITQSGGGVETYISNLIYHLKSDSFRHLIICGPVGSYDLQFANSNVTVERIKIGREISVFKDLKSIWVVWRYLRKQQIDILHGHSAKGGAIARVFGIILGRPVFFTPHAFSYLSQRGFKKQIFLQLERMLYRLLPAILVPVSRSEEHRAIRELQWRKKRIHLFRNSINPSKEINKRDVGVDTEIRITYVARLTYQKNPQMFVEIAKKVLKLNKNVSFNIVGAGLVDDCRSEVLHMINRYHLNNQLRIFEWCSFSKIEQLLSSTTVYLSTSRYEGLPIAMLEAMNHSIPILATPVDGNKDVVNHGYNGYLCRTVSHFVLRILELASNPKLRETLGANSKSLLKSEFDIRKNIHILEKLYKLFTRLPDKD